MGGLFKIGIYLPDRSPTWLDVLIVVFGLIVIGFELQSLSPSSLPAVALGFVGAAILLGPVAQTRAGKRIDEWGAEIGVLGKVAVIALYAVAVIVAFSFEATPTELIGAVAFGGILFGVLGVATHILHERQIQGWLPESS